jgi:hypothetical protein
VRLRHGGGQVLQIADIIPLHALMFRQVFRLKLTTETAHFGRHLRWLILVIWSRYPGASFAQQVGDLSEWAEQMLVYSTLPMASTLWHCRTHPFTK